MPLHLPSCSRREFLVRSLLGGVSLLTYRSLRAETAGADPHHWVLFSDPHIAADPATLKVDVNMADHLKAAVAAVKARAGTPAGLFVNGDCAYDRGLAEDYGTFTQLLEPLVETGLPIHLTLGNHDNRETFWTALKNTKASAPPVASKHVSVVEGERANWFLLDSLDVTKQTPGVLGQEQRDWLATALDARLDKPALVMVHHDPIPTDAQKAAGLTDGKELLEIVLPRRHVKAVFFGHTHNWRHVEQDGLHLVNLPAVAYSFKPTGLTGWVDCRLETDRMSLELHVNEPDRPENGTVTELKWRAA